jgi:methylglyoxal synthase
MLFDTSNGEANMKNIGLVAHDNKKKDIVEWCDFNKLTLSKYCLYATGATGEGIIQKTSLKIKLLKSGPYGGDMEIGSMIANGELDCLIFFWDPLESQPHDVDVKAVLRIAVLYNIPTACNRATADMLISSLLFKENVE